jgi:hypothetical protein
MVEDQSNVDVENVAIAQRLVGRNAVADDVVNRRASRLAVAPIHQSRRQGPVVHTEIVYQPIDSLGGDAGPDLADQHVEAFGREPASLPHPLKGSGAVDLNLSGFP